MIVVFWLMTVVFVVVVFVFVFDTFGRLLCPCPCFGGSGLWWLCPGRRGGAGGVTYTGRGGGGGVTITVAGWGWGAT